MRTVYIVRDQNGSYRGYLPPPNKSHQEIKTLLNKHYNDLTNHGFTQVAILWHFMSPTGQGVQTVSDLNYTTDGLYTRFYANTQAGQEAWNTMAKIDGNAAVLNSHAKTTIAQLRKAGYTVSKSKTTQQSDKDLLADLE